MTTLEGALRQIRLDLGAASVPFALIGGLAVSARTEPRFTRDADLAVGLTTDAEAVPTLLCESISDWTAAEASLTSFLTKGIEGT